MLLAVPRAPGCPLNPSTATWRGALLVSKAIALGTCSSVTAYLHHAGSIGNRDQEVALHRQMQLEQQVHAHSFPVGLTRPLPAYSLCSTCG